MFMIAFTLTTMKVPVLFSHNTFHLIWAGKNKCTYITDLIWDWWSYEKVNHDHLSLSVRYMMMTRITIYIISTSINYVYAAGRRQNCEQKDQRILTTRTNVFLSLANSSSNKLPSSSSSAVSSSAWILWIPSSGWWSWNVSEIKLFYANHRAAEITRLRPGFRPR